MESNDRIQVRVSDDGLEAWVAVGEGATQERSVLQDKLDAAGITTGMIEEAIDATVRALTLESAMRKDRRVARGIPAEPGTPASLALNDPPGPIPGILLEDGRIDFRERLLLIPIASGEAIGRISPAVEGKPGLDVRGESIEPPPQAELIVKHGDGISINEDGILVATRTGARAVGSDGTLDVVSLHVHSGQVDLKSGNLHSNGSLEISRDVTTGSSVRAGVDIKIGGTVDGGRVDAGGSIEILGGVIGRESGAVQAGCDLLVRHALGARLRARGRLVISRSVSTSHLVAREIEVGGKMLSDSAQAETRILLNDAGSPAGGPCVLRSAHPFNDDQPVRGSTQPPTDDSSRAKSRRVESLRARKGRHGSKGRAARPSIDKDREIEIRRRWRCRQRELQHTAIIVIAGTAHAGCRLDFGVAPLVLEEDVRARRFFVDLETQKIISVEI